MADLVVDDQEALGYWGYKTATKPSSLANDERNVAIRKGSVDYHMKGTTTASDWTHKPGGTNPLGWNYYPHGYKIWINEYCSKTNSRNKNAWSWSHPYFYTGGAGI
ncbi:hypothetical protein [Paenibacillus sp. 7541]|uniref:hypothetical protein n=1 Tax=Paenibacillus sp. 7541 TaxID=2026236 RepID=UPI0020D1DF1B|nr:hypothetical protein [Paenibacillus sp. 7541]